MRLKKKKMDYAKARGVLKKTILLAIILASVKPAHAQFDYQAVMTPVQSIICGIYSVFVFLAATLAGVVFIAAAVQWVASRDDPAKRKQAQSIMIHAIIGLMLVGIANTLIMEIGVVDGCTKEGAIDTGTAP